MGLLSSELHETGVTEACKGGFDGNMSDNNEFKEKRKRKKDQDLVLNVTRKSFSRG